MENVLVSLHSLKTMGLVPFGASAPLFLMNGELLGHSPIHQSIQGQLTCQRVNSKINKQNLFFLVLKGLSFDHNLFSYFRSLLLTIDLIRFLVFNATFSSISAISWQPVLVVEEAGVPGENHRPWASNW